MKPSKKSFFYNKKNMGALHGTKNLGFTLSTFLSIALISEPMPGAPVVPELSAIQVLF